MVNATGNFGWTFTPTDTAKYNAITGDTEVTANPVQYTLTLTGDNISSAPSAGQINSDTFVTVTVTPAAGKQVATFTVNDVDKKSELTDNKYTFTITKDTSIAVTYMALPVNPVEIGRASCRERV